MSFFKKHLLFTSYAVFLLLNIAFCLFAFAGDRVGRANGTIIEKEYTVSDFTLRGIEEISPGVYCSTTADPQMVLEGFTGTVRRVEIDVEMSRDPGEFNLFYKPVEGMEDFSAQYRTWAVKTGDSHFTLKGHGATVYALRIDPGIFAGNTMRFKSIVFNPKQPLSAYFQITYRWLFYFLTVPPFMLSLFLYVIGLFKKSSSYKSAE